MSRSAPQGYAVRLLGAGDVPTLRALNDLFGRAFEDEETHRGAPPPDAYLADLLAKSHVLVLVAECGSHLVGGLVAYVLDKYERARSEVYLYDLAVDEPHRRRGIARQLILALKPIARDRGAYVIFVQADRTDPPAIALYRSLGSQEDVHHFDIGVA